MPVLPYSKTTVVDETRGIASATPPASLNIAAIINSKTGPIDRVTLMNQDALIRNYCTGSTLSADDDETIQYVGALLNSVRVDTIRVDSSAMRSGIGSYGSKMFFDKNYNLLNNVTRFDLKQSDVVYETLQVTISESTYYLGTAPNEVGAIDLAEGLDPYPEVNLANFFRLLTNYNSTGALYDTGSYCIFDKNTSMKREDIDSEIYGSFSSGITTIYALHAGTEDMNEKIDYIKVGSYTFYPKSYSELDESELSNPVNISYYSEQIPSDIFLVKVSDYIYKTNKISNPFAISATGTLNIREFTPAQQEGESDTRTENHPVLSDELKYIAKVATDTDYDTITTNNASGVLNGGSITIGAYAFSFGNVTVSEAGVTDIHADNKFTMLGFLEWVHEKLNTMTYAEGVATKVDGIFSTEGIDVLFNSLTSPSIALPDDNHFTYEQSMSGSDVGTYYRFNHYGDSDNANYHVYEQNYIVLDGFKCYYAGTKPSISEVTTYILVSENSLTTDDFINELYRVLLSDYTVNKDATGKILISGDHRITASSSNIDSGNSSVIDQTLYTDEFAIVCRFTSEEPLFNFSYKVNNDKYKTIDLTYRFKSITDTLSFSFDGDAIDGYGRSLYYDNYNVGDGANSYIYIKKLNGSDKFEEYESGDFGNEVANNEATESDYADAILKYINYKDKAYNFICDSGHCNPVLARACKRVADKRHAQYPMSIPVDEVKEIKTYIAGANLNDYQGIYVVPRHKSAYNGQFLTIVPGSLCYIVARVGAFSGSSTEFNPLFGSSKGAVSAPNLTKIYSDSDDPEDTDTEAAQLAELNVNCIVNNAAGTYIRSNFTSQIEDSYLQDDQNAYMSNIIAHVCDEYNPNIISEVNDDKTRNRVVDELTSRLNQRMIAGKYPTVQDFRVVCDTELNTLQVIERRELIYQVWVQLPLAIRYVLAYEYVKRLGSF